MSQVIELDVWRRCGRQPPMVEDTDAHWPGWPPYRSTLVEAFVLPLFALWRCSVVTCTGWWLAPLHLAVVDAAKAGGGPPWERQGSRG